jgi:hypothetical protein
LHSNIRSWKLWGKLTLKIKLEKIGSDLLSKAANLLIGGYSIYLVIDTIRLSIEGMKGTP